MPSLASRGAARVPFAFATSVALALGACAARDADLSLPGGGAAPTDGPARDASADADADAAAVVVIGDDARAADGGADAPPCVVGGTSEALPVTVACAQPSPARLAFDAENVYWAVQGSGPIVFTASRANGGAAPLVYDSSPAVGLAVDGKFVYYTQPARGRVMRVPVGGGFPVVLADGLDFPLFLAREGTSLYWTGGATDGKVMKLDLEDGAVPVTLVDGQTSPRAIAVDGGFVYWTDLEDGAILRTVDHLTAGADGGTLTAVRLAAGIRGPSDLVLADGYAYAPDQAGRIVRVPLSGGALEPVVSVAGIPFGIATDGVAVYWSTLGDGGIFSTPIGGDGVVSTIASREASPHFLAVDDVAVTWGTWGGGGAIRKIAKVGVVITGGD